MSDLTATNCGCNNNSCSNNNNCSNGIFGNSCIWIILLLFCGGGCGNGCGNNSCGLLGNKNKGCGGNDCCEWLIWILVLLLWRWQQRLWKLRLLIYRTFYTRMIDHPGVRIFRTPND